MITTRNLTFKCACGRPLPADSQTECDKCGAWWERDGRMMVTRFDFDNE